MKFRPCIDIHEGVVKQIVGSTLSAESSSASHTIITTTNSPTVQLVENFVATKPASDYAQKYKDDGLIGKSYTTILLK